MSAWEIVEAAAPDQELLELLAANSIAGIRCPHAMQAKAREAALSAIARHGFDYYEGVSPPIGRIGITQFEHRGGADDARAYFAMAESANAQRRHLFQGSGDPVNLVINALSAAWPYEVGLARNADGETYFAGLVREIDQALLHCDWAPRDAPGWTIGDIEAQLSWNIYLSLPDAGGWTTVYDRPWDLAAEEHQVAGSYGYVPSLVKGCPSVEIRPAEGDLVFFNSRNVHSVAGGGSGRRISVSSFVGVTPARRLVLWS